MTEKKIKRGGEVLLATRGREYFVELAKKGAAKRNKMKLLWEKTQKAKKKSKNVKSVKAQA